MRKTLCAALALVPTVALATADASYTVYKDRTAFIAALAGSVVAEDFNSVLQDTYFRDAAVHFANFSVSYSGIIRNPDFNLIDTGAPISVNNVFGSAALIGGVLPNETVSISFSAPVYAFGGEWSRINDKVARSLFSVNGDTFDAGADFDGFWGIVSDNPFDTFQVVGLENAEGFGLDDALFSFDPADPLIDPVPVPAAGILFGGVAALLARRRRRA